MWRDLESVILIEVIQIIQYRRRSETDDLSHIWDVRYNKCTKAIDTMKRFSVGNLPCGGGEIYLSWNVM